MNPFRKKDVINKAVLAEIIAECILHMEYPSVKFSNACFESVEQLSKATTKEEEEQIRENLSTVRFAYIMGTMKYVSISIGGAEFHNSMMEALRKKIDANAEE